MPKKITIRWMIRRDMDVVHLIENTSFEHNWSADDFNRCLRCRNIIGMVAEMTGQTVGFMIYELKPKSIELLNFAVYRKYRHRGVGAAMVAKLKDKLSKRTVINVEVRELNLDAQLFFASQGFMATEIVRVPYEVGEENAYLMQHFHVEKSVCPQ